MTAGTSRRQAGRAALALAGWLAVTGAAAALGALAFVCMVALWLMIVATIVSFGRRERLAAILLWPYLAWVSFASVLCLSPDTSGSRCSGRAASRRCRSVQHRGQANTRGSTSSAPQARIGKRSMCKPCTGTCTIDIIGLDQAGTAYRQTIP